MVLKLKNTNFSISQNIRNFCFSSFASSLLKHKKKNFGKNMNFLSFGLEILFTEI